MPIKLKPKVAKAPAPALSARADARPAVSESAPITLPQPVGAWRVFAWLLAFFLPGLGLGLSLLYWQSDDRGRRFSRWCLGLAVLGWLLAWACGSAWTAMQGSEGGIQPW